MHTFQLFLAGSMAGAGPEATLSLADTISTSTTHFQSIHAHTYMYKSTNHNYMLLINYTIGKQTCVNSCHVLFGSQGAVHA